MVDGTKVAFGTWIGITWILYHKGIFVTDRTGSCMLEIRRGKREREREREREEKMLNILLGNSQTKHQVETNRESG